MSALTDSTFWLAFFTVAAIVVVTSAATVALRYLVFKLLHWLATEIVAFAPAPFGGWVVGLFRFFYAAALICGLTAFVLSFLIWRAPWPPSGIAAPILRNPLFWLTWLVVVTAIMLFSILCGVLLRTSLVLGLARLRKAMAREGR